MTDPPPELPPEQPPPPEVTPDQADGLLAERTVPVSAIESRMDPAAPTQQHRSGGHGEFGGLRVVIVVWCFWLLGAWATAWLSDTSVPRVRWMLFAGTLGMMLVWPAFRLSQRVAPGRLSQGALTVWLDWLAMMAVYQAVIWSLHLIAGWPLVRGVWLDAAVLAWSLLSALIVGVARLWPGAWPRVLGMLLCIALVFAEPAAVWLSLVNGGAGWDMQISPVQVLWELTDKPRTRQVYPWDRQILLVGLLASTGWLSLGLWALGAKLLRRGASA